VDHYLLDSKDGTSEFFLKKAMTPLLIRIFPVPESYNWSRLDERYKLEFPVSSPKNFGPEKVFFGRFGLGE